MADARILTGDCREDDFMLTLHALSFIFHVTTNRGYFMP